MERKLLVVDGHNLLKRGIFTAKSDNLNKGVYQFVIMLNKLIREQAPTHVVTVFDGRGDNFRKKLSSQYKEGRPSCEFTKHALLSLGEVLAAAGIYAIRRHGIEADDIIAGATKVQGFDRIIVSSTDKDFVPLLSERVSILNPLKGLITVDNCCDVYGIPHTLYNDYLVLCGDSVDRVKGIKGIGTKTAIKLLLEYGPIDDMPAKVLSKYDTSNLELERKLIGLRPELYKHNADNYVIRSHDADRLERIFTNLGGMPNVFVRNLGTTSVWDAVG